MAASSLGRDAGSLVVEEHENTTTCGSNTTSQTAAGGHFGLAPFCPFARRCYSAAILEPGQFGAEDGVAERVTEA